MIKLTKLSRFRKFLFPIFVLLLTLPTVTSLLRPGIFKMHDDISVMRLFQMDKCFSDGQLPCRWVPDMGFGYGYPQFNYYGPLPYYLQQGFHFLGLDFYSAVKLGFALSLLLGNLAMYYLGRQFFGRWGGLLSAVAYGYTPYRASDLYSRGAMGETWAFVFMPLILLALSHLIKSATTRNMTFFALSLSGLLLTHNLSAMMFVPFAACFALVLLLTEVPHGQIFSRLIKIFVGGIFAAAIAAFFFLPLAFETRLVHTDSLLSGYFNYLAHFVDLRLLFATSFWGYGSSEIGFTDDLSYFYGVIHLALAIVALAIASIKRTKISYLIFTAALIFLAATFLTHEKSTFIWKALPFLSYLQFPWRYLVVSNFFLSLIAGFVVWRLPDHIARFVTIVVIALIVLLNLAYFRPSVWFDQTYLEKFAGLSWEKQQTVSIFDYLPTSAQFPPGSPSPLYPQAVDLQGDTLKGQVAILDFHQGSNYQRFTSLSSSPAQLQLNLFDYPTWQVKLDEQPIMHYRSSDLGLVTIDLPAGQHQVEAKLTNSLVRTLGNLTSLIFFPLALILLRSKHE